MRSFVTADVSPTIDHAAVPDIVHVIAPAVDQDCKTVIISVSITQFTYPFIVHAPYVLFALSRFAKRTARTDDAVTC
jgi:hypothetical protein